MLLKREKTAKVGVKGRRKKAGRDRNYLLKVLQGHWMRRPWEAPEAGTVSIQLDRARGPSIQSSR
jgi:hypothetical protein